MYIIVINGKSYQELTEKNKTKPKHSAKVNQLMAMFGMLGTLGGFYDYTNPYAGHSGSSVSRSGYSNEFLIKEFELIQNKKSKLPRMKRDHVESSFNRKFKEVFLSEEYKYILKVELPSESEEVPKQLYFDKNNWVLTQNFEEATRYSSVYEDRYSLDFVSLKANVSEKAIISLVELSQEIINYETRSKTTQNKDI